MVECAHVELDTRECELVGTRMHEFHQATAMAPASGSRRNGELIHEHIRVWTHVGMTWMANAMHHHISHRLFTFHRQPDLDVAIGEQLTKPGFYLQKPRRTITIRLSEHMNVLDMGMKRRARDGIGTRRSSHLGRRRHNGSMIWAQPSTANITAEGLQRSDDFAATMVQASPPEWWNR